jgi:type IV fimbrial biogenesis protein FimT
MDTMAHVSNAPGTRLRRRSCTAFTLVEMLVVLAVMGVLAGIAVPAMGRMIDSTCLTFFANDFLASMYLARSEAIKYKGRSSLCKSADGASCAASGGWEQGWIVFRDANNDGKVDPGEQVVHYTQALPSGFRLTGNQNIGSYISFAPTGRTRMVSGAFQAGTITLCKRAAEAEARQIVINNTGRARVDRDAGHLCL